MNVLPALLKGLTYFFDNLLREFSEILKPFQKIMIYTRLKSYMLGFFDLYEVKYIKRISDRT